MTVHRTNYYKKKTPSNWKVLMLSSPWCAYFAIFLIYELERSKIFTTSPSGVLTCIAWTSGVVTQPLAAASFEATITARPPVLTAVPSFHEFQNTLCPHRWLSPPAAVAPLRTIPVAAKSSMASR